MGVHDVVVALLVGGLVFVATLVALGGASHGLRGARESLLGLRLASHMASARARKADSRRAQRTELVREMPTFLDIVTLGLGAGLSFDASLELYCDRFSTSLAARLREALLSWRIGASSRDEALERLADQLDVQAMRRFAATVSEALAFGTPLSHALERQAQVIRDEQRAQMEEQIEKAPVKMLIPLGSLIVPAMLLAILGPLLGPALGMA